MRLVIALLVLLLSGCNYLGMFNGPAIDEWSAEVMGLSVHYRVVNTPDPQHHGSAAWLAGVCTIALNASLTPDQQVFTAAHELAHCLDGAYLGWSSNDYRDSGCIYGPHYCSPKEGFAQAYANAYVLSCDWARSPLGLQPGDGITCQPPDPRRVTPVKSTS